MIRRRPAPVTVDQTAGLAALDTLTTILATLTTDQETPHVDDH